MSTAVDHMDIATQPNGRLSHAEHWKLWCPYCVPDVLWVSRPSHGEPDPQRFVPVRNGERFSLRKPAHDTALWTSPVGSTYGWRQWCEENEQDWIQHRRAFQLTPNITRSELVVIDGFEDMVSVLDRWPHSTERSRDFARRMRAHAGERYGTNFDFEAMANDGYAGIWLTAKGNEEVHMPFGRGPGLPPDMNAWDCETILWFRWAFSSWKEVAA